MTRIPIFQADAFTSEPFRGNPAGVCLLREEATASWMQDVAAEMNLSETAFIVPRGENNFSIRWFTPTTEVPLCGHATLASAHILWEQDVASCQKPISFQAPKGLLTAQRQADWIQLNFPALPPEQVDLPAELSQALGCQPLSAHRSSLPSYLVELDSAETVRQLQPDITLLGTGEFNRCIVTARSDSKTCDFVSRFFAPGVGIDEDPVTGSAHCRSGWLAGVVVGILGPS